jgi:LEA14-like dessication related protein
LSSLLKLLAVLGIGYVVFSSFLSGVISKLSLDSASIRFGNFTLQGVAVTVPLTIRNDSSTAIPIQGFEGAIYYGNEPLATLLRTDPVSITANALTTVNVDSTILFVNLAEDIINIIKTKSFSNNLRLVGDLFTEGIIIPINQVVTII